MAAALLWLSASDTTHQQKVTVQGGWAPYSCCSMLPDEFRDWGAGEEEWHRVSANQQMDGTGLVQLNLDGMQRSLHRQPRQVVQANSELPRSLLVVSPVTR